MLKIFNGKLSKLPFKNDYFDVITCLDVLEHSFEINNNISEIKRVLKTGGILYIQSPNYKSVMAYITGDKWDWWSPPDHVLHFSLPFLIKYFESNKFKILEKFTYEDSYDFLINIKTKFRTNIISKIIYRILLPFLIILEKIGKIIQKGGLLVIVAQKE